MNKYWIIALRELSQRLKSKSFIATAILGPLVVIGVLLAIFKIGGSNKIHWNVLIADPANIMDQKIMANDDISVTYSFIEDYVQLEDFESNNRYKEFDALLEINEKMLSNKNAFIFYREKPASLMEKRIHYQLERRVEELMVAQFTDLSLQKFREIKNPINLTFKDLKDPYNQKNSLNAWAGFFLGLIVIFFIFLFGMTIFRSIAQEKSNRISEVLLGAIKPSQLLFGKIIGIGILALIQVTIWISIIGIGLYILRETTFVDYADPSKIDFSQIKNSNVTLYNDLLEANAYNEFVQLVFERIQFSVMIPFTVLFALLGFIFYGGFFAALGSSGGSENDGQQFIFPLVGILLLSIFAGYHVVEFPESSLSMFFSYFPFTSSFVCLVKLAQGYVPGSEYQIIISILTLIVSIILVLWIAGRIFKNGILQSGHRITFKQLISWFK